MSRGRIPPDLLEKIKSAVNLVDVVGEHVVLRKSGSQLSGLCPFHSERSPSFGVSEQKQLYHCFGCKAGGDLVDFVMRIHGLGFTEAIEELAERANIPLPQDFEGGDSVSPEVAQRQKEKRDKLALAYKLNRFVAAFYRQQLAVTGPARDYLSQRGVSDALEKDFYIGAAASSWDALAQKLIAAKAPVSLAVELGLIRPSTRNRPGETPYFDLFRNRILFPLLDLRGKVVAFGGRAVSVEDTPKYLNSPESLVFHKSKTVFGLYQAQKFIREADEVIVVEGYFDAVALHAAGFRNTIATCGTALTADHYRLLRRLGSQITLLFDGDAAGQNATLRAMETGLQEGFLVRGAVLPEDLDPDELTARGPAGVEQLQALLKNAQPVLDREVERLFAASDEQSPEARTLALKKTATWLKMLSDPIARAVRVELLQKRWKITPSLLRAALGAPALPLATAPTVSPKQAPQTRVQPLSPDDRKLILSLLKWKESGSIWNEIRSLLPPGYTWADVMDSQPAKTYTGQLTQLAQNPGGLSVLEADPELLLDSLPMELTPEFRSIITEAALLPGAPLAAEDLRALLRKALHRLWARFSQKLAAELRESEAKSDLKLQAKLMIDYLDVQRKIEELKKFYGQA